MDEFTIMDKFLMLGGTTKTGSGSTGGFGVAKSLLILPWVSWRLESRDTRIDGAGIGFPLGPQRIPMRRGTRLEVVMPAGKVTTSILAEEFLLRSNIQHVNFTVNGKKVRAKLSGGHVVSSVPGEAEMYFIPGKKGETTYSMYVRINGLYMFSEYIGDVTGQVVVEITAPSTEVFTSNRDGFQGEYGTPGRRIRDAVKALGQKISKDTMSALKDQQGLVRKKFIGSGKFFTKRAAAEAMDMIGGATSTMSAEATARVVDSMLNELLQANALSKVQESSITIMLSNRFNGPDHIEAAIKQLAWTPDFFLVNERPGYKIPKKFYPETMTPAVLKLAKVWTELCRYVLVQLGSTAEYGVGFVFSTSAGAMAISEPHHETGLEESWLMLNPHKDVWNPKEIWKASSDEDLKWLYAAAIHEATHIADKISYHDETFAAALTKNMAKCADGFRSIKKIVRGIKMGSGTPTESPRRSARDEHGDVEQNEDESDYDSLSAENIAKKVFETFYSSNYAVFADRARREPDYFYEDIYFRVGEFDPAYSVNVTDVASRVRNMLENELHK
jgi:hypothetical protein